jgi:hypothetical protein
MVCHRTDDSTWELETSTAQRRLDYYNSWWWNWPVYFEHDVAIIDGKPEILLTFAYVYKALELWSNEEDGV